MSNFLMKSKDMFFDDPVKYGYFQKVFDRISRMSTAKNYYRADLFNIEEILSISEMSSFVNGSHFRDEFTQYIKDVVAYYTPKLHHYGGLPGNWEGFAFGRNAQWAPYGYFVVNLCNRQLRLDRGNVERQCVCAKNTGAIATYSVVSLNYDLVLESVCEFAGAHFQLEAAMHFLGPGEQGEGPRLAKLHGSVGDGTIVPPTWSKGSHPEIVPAWRAALEELRRANSIRFLGYSLPAADTYVRYLLKAAALDAPHLKGIDVVCWDPSGAVRAQYDDFITFANYRFVNGTTQHYLKALGDFSINQSGGLGPHWSRLEGAHEAFMASAASPGVA